ncbi:2OG-Fe(II) oxygenase [Cytobacillus purgationiresistens]|uniref:Prolyl 4-hydroxylase n=1 Tax=Cytobacillus purgationiresistens TaxID=863449 RepID=A0ABU0AB74_9BACI|nr:2OG-Fe(II) oxygenase [Cytobacillus purgationiresistens]MDQ0268502.1 prolyl 4-hydroxylase [Cytobacillus purgationiresistens]
MDKIKNISEELKEWIIHTLQSGVSPLAICNGLIKKGFDPKFAYETLFEIVGNGSVTNINHAYQYEPIHISDQGNILHTSDREVYIRAKSIKPVIIQFENVLSDDECNLLIQLAKDRLQPSKVIDANSGAEKAAAGRTSKGMYFRLQENELIAKIERRIAEITNYPLVNGEGLQVLNYQIGEEYKGHYDFFPEKKVDPSKGGQRIATMLLYLNDVEAGGETIFPKTGQLIVPRRGSAVFFHYGNSLGEVDRLSLHSSIPVESGEKWVATKWIRQHNIYHGA